MERFEAYRSIVVEFPHWRSLPPDAAEPPSDKALGPLLVDSFGEAVIMVSLDSVDHRREWCVSELLH